MPSIIQNVREWANKPGQRWRKVVLTFVLLGAAGGALLLGMPGEAKQAYQEAETLNAQPYQMPIEPAVVN